MFLVRAIMFGFVLAATPASAALNPRQNPGTEPRRMPPLEELLQVTEEQNRVVLPLECRGYYVRSKSSQAQAANLNRCQ